MAIPPQKPTVTGNSIITTAPTGVEWKTVIKALRRPDAVSQDTRQRLAAKVQYYAEENSLLTSLTTKTGTTGGFAT